MVKNKDILVENMGRINYGEKLFDRKGILDGVRLGAQFHFGWENYCLTMENLSALNWNEIDENTPKNKPAPKENRNTPKEMFLFI